MGNKLKDLFRNRKELVLSVFFTAGYPKLNATEEILKSLQEYGADLVEIGIPYSDPLADGPVIQESSKVALENGMNLDLLFRQLDSVKADIKIPIVLMGYLNPVLQFGVEKFLKRCNDCGIDAVILPDLPPDIYISEYKTLFDRYGIGLIFLVTPQTSEARVRELDKHSGGFIYLVTSASITGGAVNVDEARTAYFRRIQAMGLKNPVLAGFGISNRKQFEEISSYTSGGIIGSAFIKALKGNDLNKEIKQFLESIRDDHRITG